MEKLVLIDGHSILNRAFYGVPDLTNSEGLHTNAVYGFLNIMFKILEEEQPDYITVAFDVKAPTFRHKMYEEYKGTRKPMPQELHMQVPLIKEVLAAMGIKTVEMAGFEADDLLGTISKLGEKSGMEVSVVSGDRDLLQLATDKIKIRIPKTKKGITEIENYNAKEVKETYGVTPVEFIDVKALMGDASDNIPGAPGIGEKTATAIIGKFGSVENAYEHIEEVTPNKAKNSLSENIEQVRMSKVLATINTEVFSEYDFENARMKELYTKEAYDLFKRFEFKSLLKKFDANMAKEEKVFEENFRTIDDFNECIEYFDTVIKESNGLPCVGVYFAVEEGTLYGIAVSVPKKDTVYIPVANFITADYLTQRINELSQKGTKIAVIGFKSQLEGIHIENRDCFYDVELAAYLINPLKDTYTYDDVARDYLSLTLVSRAELMGKTTFAEAAFINAPELARYTCLNAYVCGNAYEVLMKELDAKNMSKLYTDIEMPLLFVLYDMEKEGIIVDKEALKIYGDELSVRIKELEKSIYTHAGHEFNINSPKQLGEILFEEMGLPGGKKTKTGYSTSADVLEKMREEHPIINDILEYRQLYKLKTTYADGLSVYIREDNRIHSKFNQTITATGRISSTEPNLQNIPIRMELGRLIRKVFIPREGCVFLDADYSQIELRILAHMSEDKNLIEAYKQEQDIHRMTASQVFHVPFEEVTPQLRSNAKAVNFGIVYGISSFGLSQDLSISRKEAAEYIEKYFETYPGVKEYLNSLVNMAKTKGYVTTMYNRIRPVPEIKSANFMQRSFGERIAMNSPIQGTAADIIKIAMIRVHHALLEKKLKSRLILQIHDELLIETYEEELDQVKEILLTEMSNAAQLSVPLEVDMHSGKNWYDVKG